MAASRPSESTFVDHYYMLGIDIDAHGDVIEEVYWSVIRNSRRGVTEPLTPRQMDELNEAYRVLTTPSLRQSYDEERSKILGADAEPKAPRMDEPSEPTLPFLEKHLNILQRKPEPTNTLVSVTGHSRWVPLAATLGGIGTMLSLAIMRLFM